MVAITIKNIPAELYERVKESAKKNHRSINNELITILENSLNIQPIDIEDTLNRTKRIRELTSRYVVKDTDITRLKNKGRK